MEVMKLEWIEGIYAGWLAKAIGVRLGAAVEGWTYEKIQGVYGELDGYPTEFLRFAADDDMNGPAFLIRALEDRNGSSDILQAEDVGEALLNYAPYEHGFFWWGGYGYSTEHTAYLNLYHGIPAPESGSMKQNGSTVAEQIGGQIFIDSWGLATPGKPELASCLAEKAASVTHDGNGIYGGRFIAACISFAFIEKDIVKIIEKGLSLIPEDSAYAQIVKTVMAFYKEHPEDWKQCFFFIQENYGYDKFPGNCHIIPNTAVMILALLYGEGDFRKTLNICNRCGWDTDCNVGNIATIMGVRGGISCICKDLRKPLNDFLACSSVIGSLNLQDLPYGACYLIQRAAELLDLKLPEPFKTIINNRIDSCHFEFPGSTHGMEVRVERAFFNPMQTKEVYLRNTEEDAYTGRRCLRIGIKPVEPGECVYLYKNNYLQPKDFHDSRYDPAFSPSVLPGMTLHGSVKLPEEMPECRVSLYAKELRSGQIYKSQSERLCKGAWLCLSYQLPSLDGALFSEIGVAFEVTSPDENEIFHAMVDDFYADGMADYSIEFSRENMEIWTGIHKEVSQFTRWKGNMFLENGAFHLSCGDIGEGYTGNIEWLDYRTEFELVPVIGETHLAAIRVQGAMRSYQVGFMGTDFVICKKKRSGLSVLASVPCQWQLGEIYYLEICAQGSELSALCRDSYGRENARVFVKDTENPYLKGCIGLAVRKGSHISCKKISVRSL